MTTLSPFSDHARLALAFELRRLRRARRVNVIIAGVIVLSIADLIITIAHLNTMGMMEANPIAAWLITYSQSPWMLGLFKLCTVGVCGTLLYRTRHHLSAELAAWTALGILTYMSFMWFGYSEQFAQPETMQLAQAGGFGDEWLQFP